MKRLLTIFFFLIGVSVLLADAQYIKVDKIEELPNDISARTNPRKDLNGELCAILKISLPSVADMVFQGSIVEECGYYAGVYTMYVPRGTKRISFRHVDYRPGVIDFQSLGVAIQSGHSYLVTLDATHPSGEEMSRSMQFLVFVVDPTDATVVVNGLAIPNEEGISKFPAEEGRLYSVKISAPGKVAYEGQVSLDNSKEITTRKVTLSDLPKEDAEVSITCQEECEIWVDGKKRINGRDWTGALEVGPHKVHLYKDRTLIGHDTIIVTSSNRTNVFRVKVDYGTLRVSCPIDGIPVYLDGHAIGVTPLFQDDILPGSHIVSITLGDNDTKSIVADVKPLVITEVDFSGVVVAQESVNAAKPKVAGRKTSFSMQGGVAQTMGGASFSKLISPTAIVCLGYQFTPVFGMRSNIAGWAAKGAVTPAAGTQIYSFNYVQAGIDAMFDICNMFKVNKNRIVNPFFCLGVGAAYAYNNGEANDIHAKYPTEVFGRLWDEYLWTPAGHGSLGLRIRLSRNLSIITEVGTNAMSDYFNSKDGGAKSVIDFQNTATIGLMIGGSTYRTRLR